MSEVGLQRISRELFLAAFGTQQNALDLWTIDRLTSLLLEEDVQSGQALWRVGEPLEFLYFIPNASVQLTRVGGAPWTLTGRWLLGVFEAHLDRLPPRGATALTDFRAMKIRRNAWIDLLEDSQLLARFNVERCAATVARLEKRIPRALPNALEPLPTAVTLGRSSSVIERLALLVKAEMLRGAGVQPLAELAAASRDVGFERGETVFERGSSHRNLLVVIEGELRATHDESDAIWSYGPNDVVCGAASIGGALEWRVTAATATRCISFPIESWFQLMGEHFDVTRAVMGALALRRETLLDHLAERSDGILLT